MPKRSQHRYKYRTLQHLEHNRSLKAAQEVKKHTNNALKTSEWQINMITVTVDGQFTSDDCVELLKYNKAGERWFLELQTR